MSIRVATQIFDAGDVGFGYMGWEASSEQIAANRGLIVS